MELRDATVGDESGVALVHVRSWQAGYRGLLPDSYLDGLRAEERAERYTFAKLDGPRTTVAVRAGVIVGFVTVHGAELGALYVDPAIWREGIGTALISHARHQFAATGKESAWVWLLQANLRALAFYARDGWVASGCERSNILWGAHVKELELRRLI